MRNPELKDKNYGSLLILFCRDQFRNVSGSAATVSVQMHERVSVRFSARVVACGSAGLHDRLFAIGSWACAYYVGEDFVWVIPVTTYTALTGSYDLSCQTRRAFTPDQRSEQAPSIELLHSACSVLMRAQGGLKTRLTGCTLRH